MEDQESFFSPLSIARKLEAAQGEIALALQSNGRLENGSKRFDVTFKNELVGSWDAMEGAGDIGAQDERIIEGTRTLEDRSASRAATKNWNRILLAERQIDFGAGAVGVAEDDKILRRFPKAEKFAAETVFAEIEQGFVAGEIFRGGGKSEVT